jgi:hypothetical protein
MLRHVAFVRTSATRHNISEGAIFHSHRGENFKFYKIEFILNEYSKQKKLSDLRK